jgi:hypothetical protein
VSDLPALPAPLFSTDAEKGSVSLSLDREGETGQVRFSSIQFLDPMQRSAA